ncbi:hypothetical protein Aduo_014992 [Ancylostoma duodenale]
MSNHIESRFVLIIFLDEAGVQVALLIDVQKDVPTSPTRTRSVRDNVHRTETYLRDVEAALIRLENKSAPKNEPK